MSIDGPELHDLIRFRNPLLYLLVRGCDDTFIYIILPSYAGGSLPLLGGVNRFPNTQDLACDESPAYM